MSQTPTIDEIDFGCIAFGDIGKNATGGPQVWINKDSPTSRQRVKFQLCKEDESLTITFDPKLFADQKAGTSKLSISFDANEDDCLIRGITRLEQEHIIPFCMKNIGKILGKPKMTREIFEDNFFASRIKRSEEYNPRVSVQFSPWRDARINTEINELNEEKTGYFEIDWTELKKGNEVIPTGVLTSLWVVQGKAGYNIELKNIMKLHEEEESHEQCRISGVGSIQRIERPGLSSSSVPSSLSVEEKRAESDNEEPLAEGATVEIDPVTLQPKKRKSKRALKETGVTGKKHRGDM